MGGQVEVGRIAGVPVIVNFSFIILILLWGQRGLMSGDGSMIIATLVVIAALALSIILHELGHALAGRLVGTQTRFVDLHGMGGTCHYDGALPRDRFQRLVMILAGPQANILIYASCEAVLRWLYWLTDENAADRLWMVFYVLNVVSSANFSLFWFNLMPAHPLDGGKALSLVLQKRLDAHAADTAVAWLGLIVAAGLVALPEYRSPFSFALALILAHANVEVLTQRGSPPWKLWK